MAKLFLSYARTSDEPFVKKLYTSLTDSGHEVWWDREKMPNRGLNFLQEIRDSITDSKRLILVGYPKSYESNYVRQEWEYALSICLPVMTLLREGEYDSIPAELKDKDIPDFRDDNQYQAKLDYLLRQLEDDPTPLGTLYNVPALPRWYVPRPDYLNELIQTVCADTHKPVVITSKQHMTAVYGLGGIGKTTLANALARDCTIRRTFPDGVFWLEIGQTPDIAARLGDIGIEFGDQRAEYPDEARAKSRLSAQLANKQVLLVLDDVWDHQHAEVFRMAGNRCRLLMTTRQLQIATKLGALKQEISTLTEDEGLALIAERVHRSPDDLNPYEADQRAIIRLLGGHTLAVSLAAAILDEQGEDYTPKLLQRLTQKGAFHDLHMDEKDKNHNLELCLSLSYADLSPDQQRRFRLLGIFAPESSFSAAAAAHIWQMEDTDDADDCLNDLVRAGLLKREPDDRYSLHMLLRAYAQALLQREDEFTTAQSRHFDYFYNRYGAYETSRDSQQHPHITADFPNIQKALAWGWINQPEKAYDWLYNLDNYMMFYQAYSTRRAIAQAGLEAAQQTNFTAGQANTLQALGDLDRMEDDYPNARAHYLAALPLFQAIPSRLGQANTLKALGDLDLREADYPNARQNYQAALVWYLKIPDRIGQMNTYVNLARLEKTLNNKTSACDYYEKSFAIADQLPVFANHPVVKGWRQEYAQLCGE